MARKRASLGAISGASNGANSGDRLARFRSHLGLTQEQAASLFHVGKRTWVRYESGEQLPGGKVLTRLVEAGLNPAWLSHGDEAGAMLLLQINYEPDEDVVDSDVAADVERSEPVGGLDKASILQLRNARNLVEGICSELGHTPGSIIMGAMIMCVAVNSMREGAVRHILRAIMLQSVMDTDRNSGG